MGVRVTLLVEDERLQRLAREVLLTFGFARHELRVEPFPVGRGSAKDWVTRQFAIQVRRLRAKAHQNVALLTATDADQQSVANRIRDLESSLAAANGAPRGKEEQIVLWIPKWNVETWLLHLTGDTRDEDHDYRREAKHIDFNATAQAFVQEYRLARDNRLAGTLPSLLSAYKETTRLSGP